MDGKYTKALELALAWIEAHYQPIGLVVSSSIIRGNPNLGSDFDIFVLHEQPFRQRVQKFFNGVPCEIFVNTPAQTYQYFEKELQTNRPVSAHMLATGRVIMGSEVPTVAALLTAARHYATKAPNVAPAQMQFRQYSLATLVEDAEDVLLTDPATAGYILEKVALETTEFVFWANQRPLPRIKERLMGLADVQPAAGQLLLRYYKAGSVTEKLALLRQVVGLLAGQSTFFEWTSTPEPC